MHPQRIVPCQSKTLADQRGGPSAKCSFRIIEYRGFPGQQDLGDPRSACEWSKCEPCFFCHPRSGGFFLASPEGSPQKHDPPLCDGEGTGRLPPRTPSCGAFSGSTKRCASTRNPLCYFSLGARTCRGPEMGVLLVTPPQIASSGPC